jgi:hypothetical protein
VNELDDVGRGAADDLLARVAKVARDEATKEVNKRLANLAAGGRLNWEMLTQWGHRISDDGTLVPIRPNLDLVGFTVADVPASDLTRVTSGTGGPGAQVFYNGGTTQTLVSGTDTAISFDTVLIDDASFWSAGTPTRLTVPAGRAGRYLVGGQLSYVNNASGTRSSRIVLNGARKLATNLTPGTSTSYVSHTPVGLADLVVGDYIELRGTQDSGGPLAVGQVSFNETPSLWLQRVA